MTRFGLIAILLAGCAHEAEAPHDAHDVHWGYDGEISQVRWSTLSPAFATCRTGEKQSPIDLTGAVSKPLPPIEFHYQPGPLKVVDNGHTIQGNLQPGSYIVVGGKRYDLAQFHFHHPSEHVVEGRHLAIEIHLVHKAADGQLGLMAVLIKEGAENPALAPIFSALPPRAGERTIDSFSTEAVLPGGHEYYSYTGSLTTPPCSEGAQWFVLSTPIEASSAQIEAFGERYPHNNRITKPTNGREIAVGGT
jgi:carbonic anhydrase